ncbi:MAG: NUDIX domain-containing protein [Planctomycetota bacterium]
MRTTPTPDKPYTIATLAYLFDAQGRVLMLHRCKPPNESLYSPIGGKLEVGIGESPHVSCAREIEEEAGVTVNPFELHLTGVVSESNYMGLGHWLMFLYELPRPVSVTRREFDEGRLSWHEPADLADLELPVSDRDHLWPLFLAHRGGFFAAHLACEGDVITRHLYQSLPARPQPADPLTPRDRP